MIKTCYGNFNTRIKVIGFKKGCKYQNKMGEEFTTEQLTPPGLCLHAYHISYPYCLGLFYGIKNENRNFTMIKCPNPKNPTTFKIYRIPIKNKIIKVVNISKRIISKITGLPIDPIDKKIYIKVIKRGSKCLMNYNIGKEFEFNTKDGLCPASFYSIYPMILSSKNKSIKVSCPSHKEKITYRIYKNEK